MNKLSRATLTVPITGNVAKSERFSSAFEWSQHLKTMLAEAISVLIFKTGSEIKIQELNIESLSLMVNITFKLVPMNPQYFRAVSCTRNKLLFKYAGKLFEESLSVKFPLYD
jgi:hypothetical protein